MQRIAAAPSTVCQQGGPATWFQPGSRPQQIPARLRHAPPRFQEGSTCNKVCFEVPADFKQGSSEAPAKAPATPAAFQQSSNKVPVRFSRVPAMFQEGSSKARRGSSKVPARPARFQRGFARFQQGSSKARRGTSKVLRGSSSVPVFRNMHFAGTPKKKPNRIAVGNICLT